MISRYNHVVKCTVKLTVEALQNICEKIQVTPVWNLPCNCIENIKSSKIKIGGASGYLESCQVFLACFRCLVQF